jgi:hypothetical protein
VLVSTRRVWSGRRRPWHGGIPTAGVIPFGGCHLLYESAGTGTKGCSVVSGAARPHAKSGQVTVTDRVVVSRRLIRAVLSMPFAYERRRTAALPCLARPGIEPGSGLGWRATGADLVQLNAQIFKKSLKKIVILINFILFLYYI